MSGLGGDDPGGHGQGTTIIRIKHVLHALNSAVERLLVLDFDRGMGVGILAEKMASKEVRTISQGSGA